MGMQMREDAVNKCMQASEVHVHNKARDTRAQSKCTANVTTREKPQMKAIAATDKAQVSREARAVQTTHQGLACAVKTRAQTPQQLLQLDRNTQAGYAVYRPLSRADARKASTVCCFP